MDNNFLKLLQIFIVIAITTSIQAVSTNRVGFGDPCSKTIKCKSQSWLACNHNTSQCECAKPGEMIYDIVSEKCVGTIGERCKYVFAFGDESLGSFYEKLDCVNGAKCENSDGICTCPIGTYEVVEENKCSPVKALGALCQSTIECDNTLICLNGKCDCAAENLVFESTSGTCRVKAGESCSSPNCVNGSECIEGVCRCEAGMYRNYGSCIPQRGLESNCNSDIECNDIQMLSCINGKCNCRVGYSQTSKGLCGLAYNQECSKENICSDEFLCTQYDEGAIHTSKCLCPDIELQFYDGNTCIGIVGGPCEENNGCPKNAYCRNGICNCQDGFVEYDGRNCDVAHSFVCEPRNGAPCDRLCGLLCKRKPEETEFRCKCPNDSDIFDDKLRKCQRRRYFTCKDKVDCDSSFGYQSCSYEHHTDPSGRCR